MELCGVHMCSIHHHNAFLYCKVCTGAVTTCACKKQDIPPAPGINGMACNAAFCCRMCYQYKY